MFAVLWWLLPWKSSVEKKIEFSSYLKMLGIVAWIMDCIPFSPARKKPTVEQIKARAENETGLSCYGSHPLWEEALQCYIDDIWANPQYHTIRRLTCRVEMTQYLSRRLRVINKLKSCPEIEEIELPKPIFIIGMPRTGSTFLHHSLSHDMRALTVPFWKWKDPISPENGDDNRLDKAKDDVKRSVKIFPSLQEWEEGIHNTEAHEADECFQGWIDFPQLVLSSTKLVPGLDKSSNLFWNSDVTELYANERRILQLLCFQEENTSYDWMVLKCPLNTVNIDVIHDVFPGAVFVWTHRDMKSVVCSFIGISLMLQTTVFERTNLKELTEHNISILEKLMRAGMEKRRMLEAKGVQFVDFYFHDLMSDPIRAISDMYESLGLEWTEKARQSISEYHHRSLESRKTTKKPLKFTLSDLGLDGRDIDNRFGFYYERFPNVKS